MAVVHPSYLGYYFDVRIFDHRNKEIFHFQHPEFPFITGVTVAFGKSEMSTITLTFDAPFIEGLKMLNSNMFLAYNNVEVQLGYPNGPRSRPFYGFLHQGGVGLEMSPNGLTGTITCNPHSRIELYESRQLANSLREAYVAAQGEMSGLRVEFSDGAAAEFEKFKNYPVQGRVTNREIVDLAHNLTNCWQNTRAPENGQPFLEVILNVDNTNAKPQRKFIMRGQFSEEDNSYPIISFTPGEKFGAGNFLHLSPPGASGLEASRVDKAGEVKTLHAKPEDSEEKAGQEENAREPGTDKTVKAGDGGKDVPADKKVDQSKEATKSLDFPGEGDTEWSETALKNLQTHLARTEGWMVDIVTVGIPDIETFETIEVLGMGKIFNGIFTIMRVTHQGALGDFTTTLSCVSGLVKTKVGPNKETVDG